MGYTTDFSGQISVEPPLNAEEIAFLKAFNETRRVKRERGPYFVGDYDSGVWHADGKAKSPGEQDDVVDSNRPPEGQPGLWCQWVPTDDGEFIEWDGGEKFYESVAWMEYIIDHFLKPGAEAFKSSDPQFNKFTFDHICNGEIEAQGEDPDDIWKLVVENNSVREVSGYRAYRED